jgi:sugar lactone lactonase YvrE
VRKRRIPVRAAWIAIPLSLAVIHAAEGVKLRVRQVLYADDREAPLRRPEAVAFDGRSKLVVADTGNGRLVSYDFAGGQAAPGPEIRIPELRYPVQVQVAPDGEILALDGRTHRILRISPTGVYKDAVRIPDAGTGAQAIPRSFRLDPEGRIFLLDASRGRVAVVDGDGKLLRQIPLPEGGGSYSDLAVDRRGVVFVLESVRKRVFVARPGDATFAPLTEPMPSEMDFPGSISVDGAGRIFLADRNGGGIVILGPDGSFRGRQAGMGWKEGQLRYPSGTCTSEGGILFVADRENNRIQIFEVSE